MFALAADGVTRMQRLVDREKTSSDEFYRVEKARDGPRAVPPRSEKTELRNENEKDDQDGRDGRDGRDGEDGEDGEDCPGPAPWRPSRQPGRVGASTGGALVRDRDGVLYEHRHEDIVGRHSRAENERGRRATRAARTPARLATRRTRRRAREPGSGYRTGGDAAATAYAAEAAARRRRNARGATRLDVARTNATTVPRTATGLDEAARNVRRVYRAPRRTRTTWWRRSRRFEGRRRRRWVDGYSRRGRRNARRSCANFSSRAARTRASRSSTDT